MKHQHQPEYTHSSIPNARRLRREMSEAQWKIWRELRNNQLGVKFRREVPYGPYVLDFYCVKARLNVEIDGSQHYTEAGLRNDSKRDEYLRSEGVEIIRIDNIQALTNTYNVVNEVFEKVSERLGENKEKKTPS